MGYEFDHYDRMRTHVERQEDELYELQRENSELLGEPRIEAAHFDLNTSQIIEFCEQCKAKFKKNIYDTNFCEMANDENTVDALIAHYQHFARYTDGVGKLKVIKQKFSELNDYLESCYAWYKAAI